MKSFPLLSFFLLCSTIILSQSPDGKRDNIWLFGYDSNPIDTTFGGTVLDFNVSPRDVHYEFRDMNLWTTEASVCDKEGNLLFYTNGIYIANAEHEQMVNGGGLNPGGWTSSYAEIGLPAEQGALILPQPGNDSIYFLIHGLLDLVEGFPHLTYTHLYYSVT